MGAVLAVTRAEARRHLRRYAAWALAVAIVGGVVVASALGAERSRTSLDRFVRSTDAADVGVFAEDPDDLDLVRDLPGVERTTAFDLVGVVPAQADQDMFLPMLAAEGGRIPYDLNGVRVLDGRLPSPESTDEIALHESTARLLDVGVGDRLPMLTYTPADVARLFEEDGGDTEATGPDFDLRVAAIVRDPVDVISRPGDIVLNALTPGVTETHGAAAGTLGFGAFVELAPGIDVEAFTAEVRARDLPLSVERWIGADEVDATGFGATLGVIGDGLLAVAVVLGVAGAFVLGQALLRHALATRPTAETLAALGLPRRHRVAAVALPGFLVAVVGAVGTVLLAVPASALFPVGLARRAEPDPGVRWDPGVLIGALGVLAAMVALVTVATWVALRPASGAPRQPARLAWAPGPAGRAVAAGARRSSWSSRAAVGFGMAGVVAAITFAASLDGLLEDPRQYGWSFDATVEADNFDASRLVDPAALLDDPAVADAREVIFQIDVDVEGSPVFGYAIGDGSGDIVPIVAEGRAPRTTREVALGRETMARVGRGIGDQVTLETATGEATFDVVGQAIIPVGSDGNVSVGDGVTLSVPAAERLGVTAECESGSSCYRQTAVRFVDGADLRAAGRRLLAEPGADFDRPSPPPEVTRLREVAGIPWVVAGLLGVLAAVATVHSIVETVVRRRRDLAVLRALGATPGDNRRAVIAHAAVMVGSAAVVGLVAGLVVGRSLWRSVAGAVGVVAAPVAPAVVLAVPLAAVALAALASVHPARRAGRLRPADVLRAE